MMACLSGLPTVCSLFVVNVCYEWLLTLGYQLFSSDCFNDYQIVFDFILTFCVKWIFDYEVKFRHSSKIAHSSNK